MKYYIHKKKISFFRLAQYIIDSKLFICTLAYNLQIAWLFLISELRIQDPDCDANLSRDVSNESDVFQSI